jgi:hypothetical protein
LRNLAFLTLKSWDIRFRTFAANWVWMGRWNYYLLLLYTCTNGCLDTSTVPFTRSKQDTLEKLSLIMLHQIFMHGRVGKTNVHQTVMLSGFLPCLKQRASLIDKDILIVQTLETIPTSFLLKRWVCIFNHKSQFSDTKKQLIQLNVKLATLLFNYCHERSLAVWNQVIHSLFSNIS